MPRPKSIDEAVRKMVSVSAETAKAIDDYRFGNRIRSEAEAIRRLIEAGLAAEKAKKKGKQG
jgi:hypothetical protein